MGSLVAAPEPPVSQRQEVEGWVLGRSRGSVRGCLGGPAEKGRGDGSHGLMEELVLSSIGHTYSAHYA